MNRRNRILLMAALSLAFAGLVYLFYDFVFDDAFIIYRYANNLAAGAGLVWNPGQEPVEGYTSILWVLLNAGAVVAGIDPLLFSKAAGIASALMTIWILVIASKDLDWGLAFIFASALALSPAFAFLSVLGMETALTSLLILASAFLAIRMVRSPKLETDAVWHAFALIGFFARPDTAAFNCAVWAGLIIARVLKKDRKSLVRFVMSGIPFFLVFLAYTYWRLDYFGNFFPNSFYVKIAAGGLGFDRQGALYLLSFTIKVLLPYLLLAAYFAIRLPDWSRLAEIFPVLLGCLCFGAYILFVSPVQGFLWRFIFPAYPALLMVFVYYFSGVSSRDFPAGWRWMRPALMVFFALWTLRLIQPSLQEKEARTTHDRMIVGKMLANLSGTMFVSESGALPYYSGWESYDLLGLTSEEIAGNGLSYEALERINPDLIMLHELHGYYSPDTPAEWVLNQYMRDRDFVAVSAIQKCSGQYHFYFARRDSPLFKVIATRLTDIDAVEYGDLYELMQASTTVPRSPSQ